MGRIDSFLIKSVVASDLLDQVGSLFRRRKSGLLYKLHSLLQKLHALLRKPCLDIPINIARS